MNAARHGVPLLLGLLAMLGAQRPADAAGATAPDEAVNALLDQVVTRTGLPGMTFAVYDGRVVHNFAVGWADRERHRRMTPRSVMMGASTGKMLVAVLAYQEMAAGRLHPADLVSQYLGKDPAYGQLPGAARFTVQMLLTHSTGLVDGAVDHAAMTDSEGEWTNARRFKAAWDTPLLFEPGSAYSYSDLNYQLLAAVVESIEGSYFGDLATARIIRPLHMIDTHPATHRSIPNLATGYAGPTSRPQYEDIPLPDRTAEAQVLFMNPAFEGGGGGFSTTSADMARFMYALLATTLIGARERRYLLSHWTPVDSTATRDYGAGVFRYRTALGTAYGHSGLWFGYKTQVQYYPALHVSAALQVNSQIDGEGNDLAEFKTGAQSVGIVELLTALVRTSAVHGECTPAPCADLQEESP